MANPYPRTFSHIGISVPDLEAAVKFYTEVLGWYLIMEPSKIVEDDSAIGEMCSEVFGPGGSISELRIFLLAIALGLNCLSLRIKKTLKITLSIGKPAYFIFVFKTQMLKNSLIRLLLLAERSA